MPHYVSYASRIFHRGTVSIFLALAFFFFNANSLQAQVEFNDKGLLKVPATNQCYQQAPVFKFIDTGTLAPKSGEQLKKWFLERVDKTIYFLSDPGNRKQYDLIWDSTVRIQIQNELAHLRSYLTGTTAANCTNGILPTSLEIDSLTKTTILYSLSDTSEQNDPNSFMAKLLRFDPLKRYLYKRYIKELGIRDTALNLTINYDYVSQWRKLEKDYDSILVWQREIKRMDSTLMYDTLRINAITRSAKNIDLNRLGIVAAIKDSKFMQRWIWLNDGVIAINPLIASDVSGRLPADEPNRFQTPQMAKALDSVHNSKRLKDFSTYTKLYNKALFPRDPRTDKEKKGSRSTAYLEAYNANDSYKRTTCVLNYIGENDYLRVAVHNVDADKVLTPKFSFQKINEENNFTAGLNEVASNIGTLVSTIQPKTAAFSLLAGMINTQHLNSQASIKLDASANLQQIQQIFQNYKGQQKYSKAKWKYTFGPDSLFAPENADYLLPLSEREPRVVIINDSILVPMTKTNRTEDKRNILWASDNQTNYTFGNPNRAFAQAIEVFLEFDKYNFIDYSTTDALKQSAKNLLARFNTFKNDLNTYKTTAQKAWLELQTKGEQIESYLRITNRSLPTKDLKSVTDTTAPAYRTVIYKPEKIEAFNKLNLTVEETVEGKKETANTAIDHTVKVTKYRKFDVSVGLAFTTDNYEVISQKGTTPPTTETADRLQFFAGAHWYVFGKINKLDGRLFGKFCERFSMFAGLGIKYPLENYYIALSYDLVPGCKIMAGGHLYLDKRFKVRNDIVVDKASAPAFAGPFISLNLEPVTLVKLVGLIK